MSSSRLRILHLTAGSDAGGLSRYIYDISMATLAGGHDVAIAGEVGAWHWLFERAPFPWIELPLKGGLVKLARARRTLRKWLETNPVDVIHTHYRRPTLVARRLGRRRTPPILYTVHLSDLNLAWPWRMLTDFGDRTHVASVEARRWVVEQGHVPPECVSLIHHGINASNFPVRDDLTRQEAKRSLGIASATQVAAFVGRLDDPKNAHWLLDVAERVPELHVLIAGEGPHEGALRLAANARRLTPRFHLLGHRDPLPVYQAADVLLLPSLREGFSLVTIEAMSVGVPVFRTLTAGSAELIIENVTGRTTSLNHDEFVQHAVEFLALPAATLRQMGSAAAVHVRQNFTFDRQVELTLALYRELATLTRT